jgi:hypothetical protein
VQLCDALAQGRRAYGAAATAPIIGLPVERGAKASSSAAAGADRQAR